MRALAAFLAAALPFAFGFFLLTRPLGLKTTRPELFPLAFAVQTVALLLAVGAIFLVLARAEDDAQLWRAMGWVLPSFVLGSVLLVPALFVLAAFLVSLPDGTGIAAFLPAVLSLLTTVPIALVLWWRLRSP
jgi:hypothetical protein